MIKFKCPGCGVEIETEIDGPGDIVACEECGNEILITKLKPLQFELLDEEK